MIWNLIFSCREQQSKYNTRYAALQMSRNWMQRASLTRNSTLFSNPLNSSSLFNRHNFTFSMNVARQKCLLFPVLLGRKIRKYSDVFTGRVQMFNASHSQCFPPLSAPGITETEIEITDPNHKSSTCGFCNFFPLKMQSHQSCTVQYRCFLECGEREANRPYGRFHNIH